ncbi:uncharacterized protein L3040_001990 [Drepanopeziza brunnea f. sp. 'multigermtubi']|uniref:CCHC-type domain-containing protein n=1 Tax=Marssonina brunnea f. sp. multigermtubi (strain MB_m1) TaxID=1072389 RepID=K1WQ12_MARBU|nr:putative protein MPE1 [Drepanopeziza brunnea f. sp. 'multigermtubi' MB_m1]EKD19665.1 putative protein MPE1 [Drepanopeziza brunnea f. sp. 'multigermtubi' MB_m1]KAJ5052233.1 hypothetical protein L3040_001990 [Drepanopeziza brunnea f. sp. 'multigermtubi']
MPRASRPTVGSKDMIIDPYAITDRELFYISQRSLSKSLSAQVSSRATFAIYLRWLEVHRQEPSRRSEHWSNTVMHWVQSLRSRGYQEEEIIGRVEEWKREEGPWMSRSHRHPPTERDIRKAFDEDTRQQREGGNLEERMDRERLVVTHGERKASARMMSGGHDIYRPSDSLFQKPEEAWERKERKRIEQYKLDLPPPVSYICNRCGKKGHHLQMCPTNMDASFDRPPAVDYRCDVCHERGVHFKSLCPKNTDPYSIIQKRKARGIATPTKNDRKKESSIRSRMSDFSVESSSTSSTSYSFPPSVKKLELIESLQDLEKKKQNLFQEQSEEIVGMIREGTGKRVREQDYSRPSGSPQRRKVRKTDREVTPSDNEQDEGGRSDVEMIEYIDENAHADRIFALRPIEISSASRVSDQRENFDEEIEEFTIEKPTKEYPPFVRMLMRTRPEMSEIVNHINKRRRARDMWEQVDREQQQQVKFRPRPTGLFSYEDDQESLLTEDSVVLSSRGGLPEIKMQYDGTCDEPDSRAIGFSETVTSDLRTTHFSKSSTLTTKFRKSPTKVPKATIEIGDGPFRTAVESKMVPMATRRMAKKIEDLKKFGSTFKLATPVPNDLVQILSNNPAKQEEIRKRSGAQQAPVVGSVEAWLASCNADGNSGS